MRGAALGGEVRERAYELDRGGNTVGGGEDDDAGRMGAGDADRMTPGDGGSGNGLRRQRQQQEYPSVAYIIELL